MEKNAKSTMGRGFPTDTLLANKDIELTEEISFEGFREWITQNLGGN